jgi:hypothetical protein
MSPIQFSALKALNPLEQEPERGENHDGQTDIEKVLHGALLGVPLRAPPRADGQYSGTVQVVAGDWVRPGIAQ